MAESPNNGSSGTPSRKVEGGGFFRKAVVVGLLTIAGAALVNLLVLSRRHPQGIVQNSPITDENVIVASILTSVLLVIAVSITVGVVTKGMSHDDHRVDDIDKRLEELEAKSSRLDALITELHELKVENIRLNGLLNRLDELAVEVRQRELSKRAT